MGARDFVCKTVLGCNFWLECPVDLRSTFLRCIFYALFRHTQLGHIRHTLPNSQMSDIWTYLSVLQTQICFKINTNLTSSKTTHPNDHDDDPDHRRGSRVWLPRGELSWLR